MVFDKFDQNCLILFIDIAFLHTLSLIILFEYEQILGLVHPLILLHYRVAIKSRRHFHKKKTTVKLQRSVKKIQECCHWDLPKQLQEITLSIIFIKLSGTLNNKIYNIVVENTNK